MVVDGGEVAELEMLTRALIGITLQSLEVLGGEVSMPQFRLLLAAAALGRAPSSRLAEAAGVPASSVTRLADRLETAGLLARGADARSRSIVTIEITSAGRDLVAYHTAGPRPYFGVVLRDGVGTISIPPAPPRYYVVALAYHHGQGRAAYSDELGRIVAWDVARNQLLLETAPRSVYTASFREGGGQVAFGHEPDYAHWAVNRYGIPDSTFDVGDVRVRHGANPGDGPKDRRVLGADRVVSGLPPMANPLVSDALTVWVGEGRVPSTTYPLPLYGRKLWCFGLVDGKGLGIPRAVIAGTHFGSLFVLDPDTGGLISDAQVAEVEYTAFATTRYRITARLIVRRVLDANTQDPLFPVWRYHPFLTNSTETTTDADITHRQHAICETVWSDLIDGPWAHQPSGTFAANAAWCILAAICHNLLRAAGTLTGTTRYTMARGATLRTHLINIPARLARPQRRPILHLPTHWPRAYAWQALWQAVFTT